VLQSCDTSTRRQLSLLFDDDAPPSVAAHAFNIALALLIIVNVIAIILETVEPIRDRFAAGFYWAEHVATAIFGLEYVLRVWTCVDYRGGRFRDPITGRLRYMHSFFAMVDLVAVLPALIGVLGAGDLRILRLVRLLRMLKLTRHSTVFKLLWSVFREEAHAFAGLVFILFLTLTISGALMYMLEADEQPAVFNSIPAAMWWAVETLTTVGYGDMVPITTAGRVLGGIISIVGICTLALFSGLVTVGYLERLRAFRAYAAANAAPAADGSNTSASEALPPICPHCGHSLHGAGPQPTN
jgi:voltage-gated potassium channel